MNGSNRGLNNVFLEVSPGVRQCAGALVCWFRLPAMPSLASALNPICCGRRTLAGGRVAVSLDFG